jgi:N-acetylated-alpha-linked acidic dipeptidase
MILRKPLVFLLPSAFLLAQLSAQTPTTSVFGYSDFTKQAKIEAQFLAVPDAKLAGEELKTLTAEPHLASTPEDRKTAEYVAQKFRAAGLETEIVPYRVLMNQPKVVQVEAFDASGQKLMTGPSREHVPGDPFQDDPRVVMPFNGSSGSGDVTGEVVYANYGRLEDFDQLAAQHIDLHGKIVIVRYGANFRGVKVYIAQQRGAAGVLIYSDPQDDGYYKGDAYPLGPWRPDSGVQRGSVQFLFEYPGDPETPGVASTPDLPDSARINPEGNQPHIISIPLSYHDASPILQALKGPGVPQGWQGALPAALRPTSSPSRITSAEPSGTSSEKSKAQTSPTNGSWPAITATHGFMEPSIPTAVPPPCLRPFTASVLSSTKVGARVAPSSSAAGTPKRKA